jgi:polyisoprenoid-binding protein YceI|tara:strand:- start:144 stop:722 length:579 start_codon:yes stop_codon:yes gene_type:complete
MKKIAFCFLLASCMATPTSASWTLDGSNSTLSFISTKAINVAEVHSFGALAGSVNDAGEVEITIDLTSVDTGIEIRDDRMQEMLFDTASFSSAVITTSVDMGLLSELAMGESSAASVGGELALHGHTVPLTFDVLITRTSESGLLVVSKQPVVISAAQFGLAEGVDSLREIAGLPSISVAVPVSFVLSFNAD